MFWENFYEACKRNNTTPSAVCAALGLSNATATGWKKRGVSPNGEILVRIAEHLNCSVDYLLGHTNTPNAEKPAATKGDELSLDPLDAQLMDLLPHLTDDQKKLLYAQIKTLLDTQ